MLVLRVEIWPGGYENGKREIASARIANMSDLADVSNYACVFEEVGSDRLGIPPSRHSFDVKEHPRRSIVWALIRKALNTGDF